MRFDLLARLRKWHLLGVLSVIFVSIACASTTVHALQHVASATSSTINPGDTEACGLCHLETSVSSKPSLTADVVLFAAPAYGIPCVKVINAPGDATFSESLRGPPVAA